MAHERLQIWKTLKTRIQLAYQIIPVPRPQSPQHRQIAINQPPFGNFAVLSIL